MKTQPLMSPHLSGPTFPEAKNVPGRESGRFPAAPAPERGKRILLADDDPGVRGSLSDVLVTEGYVVIPANDGQQALQIAASTQVDLILLDLNMPVKNGWDTFERFTREHPLVPVIIITARPNQLFTAMGAGVGALLEKPMDMQTLLTTVSLLLAEPIPLRLARLAGHATDFHYAAAPRPETPATSAPKAAGWQSLPENS